MTVLTVTAKGQVTLRRDLLRHLGVGPGDKIQIEKLPDGRVEVKAANPAGNIADCFNRLRRKGRRALSLEEMGSIAADAWAKRR